MFFLLVFALSVPFWVLGSAAGFMLLPGLPVAALAFVCPLLAALILLARDNGSAAVAAHFKRSLDFERIRSKIWYAPIVLVMPAISLLTYGAMRWLDLPLPSPEFPWRTIPALFLLFFVAALVEELGWSGYVLDPLQSRWSALQAGVIIGLIWAVWHLIPLLQAGRAPEWIAWWSLATVATRVLHVWLYNNTGGSVFGASLFHAMGNVSWQMFPNQGSHYDPRITGLILASTAAFVTLVWGRATLARRAAIGSG